MQTFAGPLTQARMDEAGPMGLSVALGDEAPAVADKKSKTAKAPAPAPAPVVDLYPVSKPGYVRGKKVAIIQDKPPEPEPEPTTSQGAKATTNHSRLNRPKTAPPKSGKGYYEDSLEWTRAQDRVSYKEDLSLPEVPKAPQETGEIVVTDKPLHHLVRDCSFVWVLGPFPSLFVKPFGLTFGQFWDSTSTRRCLLPFV